MKIKARLFFSFVFFTTPFFVFGQPVISSCYDFASNFGNPGGILNVNISSGGQNKIWPTTNQNPPTLLQQITFVAKTGPNGQPLCNLVKGFKADAFFCR